MNQLQINELYELHRNEIVNPNNFFSTFKDWQSEYRDIDFQDNVNLNAVLPLLNKCNSLFYPGAGYDFSTLRFFMEMSAVKDYYYCDYINYDITGKTNLLNSKLSINDFGGMNEYCLQNLKPTEYFYCTTKDSHINSFGNIFFYENVYRKWFIDWNIFENKKYKKSKEITFISKKSQKA